MKKRILSLFLVTVLLLGGCTGEPVPSQPTDEITTRPTMQSTTVPTETEWPYAPELQGRSIITPEDGVLILNENESFEDAILEGDVYITANAEVSFHNVSVQGNLYVHGKLTYSGSNGATSVYTYKYDDTMCSAYDGIHGKIQCEYMASASFSNSGRYITVDALDYAFETWGKVEPTEQPPTRVWSEEAEPSPYDPAKVTILSGKQTITSKSFPGDVYITADGDVFFADVTVLGNLYVAGKLHLSDMYGYKTNVQGYVYAYDFGVTCEVFDGTHGQITGGPIFCKGYVVANDALDYAFDTWGKQ